MPNFLTTQYYPDDFQVMSAVISPAVTAQTVATYAFFYADRDLVIDSIIVGAGGNPATATNIRMLFRKTTTGTLASPASAGDISSGTTISPNQNLPTSGGGTFNYPIATPASDLNLVKAGNWVGFTYSTNDANGFPTYAIQVRVRSRLN